EIKVFPGVCFAGRIVVEPEEPAALEYFSKLTLRGTPVGPPPPEPPPVPVEPIVHSFGGDERGGNTPRSGPSRFFSAQARRVLPVALRQRRSYLPFTREVPVNPDGKFELTGLPPRPCDISLGYSLEDLYFRLVRIEYPGPKAEVQIAVPDTDWPFLA